MLLQTTEDYLFAGGAYSSASGGSNSKIYGMRYSWFSCDVIIFVLKNNLLFSVCFETKTKNSTLPSLVNVLLSDAKKGKFIK